MLKFPEKLKMFASPMSDNFQTSSSSSWSKEGTREKNTDFHRKMFQICGCVVGLCN